MAAAQGERCTQLLGPGVKWVCSRSRPAVREVATWSRRRASGLADGAAGHLRPLVPGPDQVPGGVGERLAGLGARPVPGARRDRCAVGHLAG
jgi:hypothetical protein